MQWIALTNVTCSLLQGRPSCNWDREERRRRGRGAEVLLVLMIGGTRRQLSLCLLRFHAEPACRAGQRHGRHHLLTSSAQRCPSWRIEKGKRSSLSRQGRSQRSCAVAQPLRATARPEEFLESGFRCSLGRNAFAHVNAQALVVLRLRRLPRMRQLARLMLAWFCCPIQIISNVV